jgi:hypothetical protein
LHPLQQAGLSGGRQKPVGVQTCAILLWILMTPPADTTAVISEDARRSVAWLPVTASTDITASSNSFFIV